MFPPAKKVKHQHVVSQQPRPVQSPLALLLNLPRELRDLIYGQCGLDWKSINTALQKFDDDVEAIVFKHKTRSQWEYGAKRLSVSSKTVPDDRLALTPRSTPMILLICRQITDEALDYLHAKPLVIGPPASLIPKNFWPFQVTAFISSSTLRHVRHLILSPDERGRSWCNDEFMGYQSYVNHMSIRSPTGQTAFEMFEVDDMQRWVWGLRSSLQNSTALRCLEVRFMHEHTIDQRKLYYEHLFPCLLNYLPMVDLRLPEEDEVADQLICDLKFPTASSSRAIEAVQSYSNMPLVSHETGTERVEREHDDDV